MSYYVHTCFTRSNKAVLRFPVLFSCCNTSCNDVVVANNTAISRAEEQQMATAADKYI